MRIKINTQRNTEIKISLLMSAFLLVISCFVSCGIDKSYNSQSLKGTDKKNVKKHKRKKSKKNKYKFKNKKSKINTNNPSTSARPYSFRKKTRKHLKKNIVEPSFITKIYRLLEKLLKKAKEHPVKLTVIPATTTAAAMGIVGLGCWVHDYKCKEKERKEKEAKEEKDEKNKYDKAIKIAKNIILELFKDNKYKSIQNNQTVKELKNIISLFGDDNGLDGLKDLISRFINENNENSNDEENKMFFIFKHLKKSIEKIQSQKTSEKIAGYQNACKMIINSASINSELYYLCDSIKYFLDEKLQQRKAKEAKEKLAAEQKEKEIIKKEKEEEKKEKQFYSNIKIRHC